MTEKNNELFRKGAIQECQEVKAQFISFIFIAPKPDGSHRF